MKRPYEPVRTLLFALCTLTPILLAGPPAGAQEAPPPQPSGQEIVELEHADPKEVARVIRVFEVHAQAHPELGLVTINGFEQDVEAARAAAIRLDRPPEPTASIQVTAYVLEASRTDPLNGGVPPALEAVAEQLRQVFGFEGVELIDSMSLRTLDGGDGQVTGSLPAVGERGAMPYRLGFNRVQVLHGERTSVRLEGFAFHTTAHRPAQGDGEESEGRRDDTSLVTDLEVRTGQKAVVGKAASASSRAGLILVVEVEVLE